MTDDSDLISLNLPGKGETEIEYRFIDAESRHTPLVVFLHEGLGSAAMWKDFPERLCNAAGVRGLVFSRPGYGRSSPRSDGERWGVDFMHFQARKVLPALLAELRIDCAASPPVLFGHSDGASIALLYAASFPGRVSGLIVLAPHLFVEAISIESIRKARQAYLETDLRTRLARYHADPDSAFWGWNDIWLDPEFSAWNIEHEVTKIKVPVLAMQGVNDEYGTMEQVHRISEICGGCQVVEIPDCGHSPHRDQAETVLAQAGRFIRNLF